MGLKSAFRSFLLSGDTTGGDSAEPYLQSFVSQMSCHGPSIKIRSGTGHRDLVVYAQLLPKTDVVSATMCSNPACDSLLCLIMVPSECCSAAVSSFY